MYDLVSANGTLMQGATLFDLSDKRDRQRSALKLRELFIDMHRAVQTEIVLEIGAREASFARTVRRRLPAADIFAFEANPHNFERFNSPRMAKARVEYLHQAVSDRTGTATFHIQSPKPGSAIRRTAGSHSLMKRADVDASEEISVPVTTWDDFIEGRGLGGRSTSAWIDVEGAIGNVLEGAERSLENVELLLVEVESVPKWSGQWLWSRVHEHLASRGLVALARDFQYSAQFNVVFVRQHALDSAQPVLERYYSALALEADRLRGRSLVPGVDRVGDDERVD